MTLDHEAVLAAIGFLSRTVMALRSENEQLRSLANVPAGMPLEMFVAQQRRPKDEAPAESNGKPVEEVVA